MRTVSEGLAHSYDPWGRYIAVLAGVYTLFVFLDFNFASRCMLKEVLSDENKSALKGTKLP